MAVNRGSPKVRQRGAAWGGGTLGSRPVAERLRMRPRQTKTTKKVFGPLEILVFCNSLSVWKIPKERKSIWSSRWPCGHPGSSCSPRRRCWSQLPRGASGAVPSPTPLQMLPSHRPGHGRHPSPHRIAGPGVLQWNTRGQPCPKRRRAAGAKGRAVCEKPVLRHTALCRQKPAICRSRPLISFHSCSEHLAVLAL